MGKRGAEVTRDAEEQHDGVYIIILLRESSTYTDFGILLHDFATSTTHVYIMYVRTTASGGKSCAF